MKRITSAMLALLLLASLMFACSLTVSAATDLVASDECIEVLKKYEGFSSKPYWDVSQWTVGYGTRCPSDKLEEYRANGITKEEAEKLLRNYVSKYEADLHYFEDKYNISFNQGQLDALILFSYNCGSGWVYSTAQNFHQAIAEQATGNELIYWFSRWCKAGSSINTALLRRRLCEANMYLNGEYSTTPPSNYCYVFYDANGGEMDGTVQGFDANLPVDFASKPTLEGKHFQGWYTSASGGAKVSELSAAVQGMTLYAQWGSEAPDEDEPVEEFDPVMVKVIGDGVNVRKGPGTNYTVVGRVSKGQQIGIYETAEGSGYQWGRFSQGWIVLDYTTYGMDPDEIPDLDQPEEEQPEAEPVKGIVKVSGGLNIRSGPGTGYASVGSYRNGDQVEILEQKTVGSMIWGKTDKGWISMSYVVLAQEEKPEETPEQKPEEKPEETPEQKPEEKPEETPSEPAVTGTITTTLRIRTGPGTNYGIAGYYYAGNKVTITEQKSSGSTTWGKTDKGWISMNYVKLDANDSDTGDQTPEEKPEAVKGTVKVSDILRVRSGPGTSYAICGYLYNGNQVTITEQKTVGSTTWGKTDKGWVSMDYIVLAAAEKPEETPEQKPEEKPGDKPEETPEQKPEEKPEENPEQPPENDPANATVTGKVKVSGGLCIRSGAGSNYSVVGYYYNGDAVTVTQRQTVGNTIWGKTDKGWISMNYVELDEGSEEMVLKTGTITASCLRVRKDTDTGSAVVGYLYKGAKVEILQIKTVGGTEWGRIATGWVCMDYVK